MSFKNSQEKDAKEKKAFVKILAIISNIIAAFFFSIKAAKRIISDNRKLEKLNSDPIPPKNEQKPTRFMKKLLKIFIINGLVQLLSIVLFFYLFDQNDGFDFIVSVATLNFFNDYVWWASILILISLLGIFIPSLISFYFYFLSYISKKSS